MPRLPATCRTGRAFTASALAPGVLNTTTPASAHLSSGMLFTPRRRGATAKEAFGQVHVVHGGAAHEHAGGLRDVVGELIVDPAQVGSLWRRCCSGS